MTTSNDPDEIRADIERTRAALSSDVDDLAESVKPKNVAERQVGKVEGRRRLTCQRRLSERHKVRTAIVERSARSQPV